MITDRTSEQLQGSVWLVHRCCDYTRYDFEDLDRSSKLIVLFLVFLAFVLTSSFEEFLLVRIFTVWFRVIDLLWTYDLLL